MELDEWHGPVAANCTQVGDIFDIVVILPCKLEGHRRQVRVIGVGSDLTKATVDLFRPQPDDAAGPGLE